MLFLHDIEWLEKCNTLVKRVLLQVCFVSITDCKTKAPVMQCYTTVSHVCAQSVEPLVADVVADAEPPPTFHQWHDRGHAMWWGLISPTQRQPRGPQRQHATGHSGLGWPSVTSNSVTPCQTWQQPVCLQLINYLSLQARKIVMFDWILKACTKSVPYHLHVNWAFW